MTYNPHHFEPQELIPPGLSRELMENQERIFSLFDDRLLKTADRLRHRYGPMIINDYKLGGNRTESGLRRHDATTGAALSDHKFGRALDCVFKNISAGAIRREILSDPWNRDFEFITCLEMTVKGNPVSWLHFSTRNWDKARHGIQQLHI